MRKKTKLIIKNIMKILGYVGIIAGVVGIFLLLYKISIGA